MKTGKQTLRSLIGCAALALLATSPASADAWDKKTNVTFREAVEFPGGTVLAPGNYVLKLLNSATDRHIVQVYDRDQQHMYAMVMAIPAQRIEPADKTILTFYETPRDRPAFIRTWFYPGDTIGQEFPYPKNRPYYVASSSSSAPPLATAENSRATGTDSSSARSSFSLTEPTSDPNEARVTADPIILQEPAPAEEPVLLAQATPQQVPQRTPPTEFPAGAAPVPPAAQLPETASRAPYWAACSVILLAGAFLLRAARRIRS